MLEGIADVEALVYRRLRELGAPTLKTVRTVGGGARNPAWTRIRARKLSAPLLEPVSGEAVASRRCLFRRAMGSCPAVACMPSKNELWSARVAHFVHHAADFGTLTGPARTDMRKVRSRKQDMVEREIAIHLKAYKESGAELIMGSGRFVGPKTVEVALNDGGARALDGAEVVLNLGSHAAIPDIPGIEAARPLTHIEALELDYLPSHLIVLGGGYVGIETAQTFRRFGSRVTIIEPGRQPMGREDRDVAQEIQAILTGEGVEVVLNADPESVHGLSGDAVAVSVRTAEGERTIEGSDLTATILKSSTEIWVNCGLPAHSPNMAGANRRTDDRQVPYVMFTDPPLARVGLSEAEAQRQGVSVRVGKLPMSQVLRTEATDEKTGFMKVVVSASDDRILGFTMIGSEAGEVLAVVQTAMMAELPYPRLRDAVFSHLTMAEGLGFLFATVPERSA